MSDELKYTVFPHVEAKVEHDLRTLRKVLNVPDPADVEAVAMVIATTPLDPSLEIWRSLSDIQRNLYIAEAEAAIAALINRGWTPPTAPSSAAPPPADKAGE